MKLYKTIITVWSNFNPSTSQIEVYDLVRDAIDGESYCSGIRTILVPDPEYDPDWDGTEFFTSPNEDEE
jgi:hypothetical protein